MACAWSCDLHAPERAVSYLDGALVRRQRLFQALLATALVHNLLFL